MVRWRTEGKTDFFFNTLSFMSLWCYLPKSTSVNNYNINKSPIRGGSRGWHSGESARLPPMWHRYKSRLWHHMWAEFSPLLREVFLWVLQFSPLLKNQHFQIPIWPGIRQTKNHFVDVLPPNHYSSIYLSCNQAVYLKTARVRGHVQGSHKGSWPFTSQVDYKVRRRAQNMSGCQNCHQQGRWHVEWREKMRDCIYPFLTSRLSKHKKKIN